MADPFGTAISLLPLVYNFVSACAEFSSQAGKLAVSISMDMRGLTKVKEFLDKYQKQQDHTLSPDDERLIGYVATHINGLMDKASRSIPKLRCRGFGRAALAATWFVRRSDLLQLHDDLRDMLETLGVRVIRLPEEVLSGIRLDIGPEESGRAATAPPVIRANEKLRGFDQLVPRDKKERGLAMRLRNPSGLDSDIADLLDISSFPMSFEGQEFIFASRSVSEDVLPGTPAFDSLETDVGILAAALNCLDPAADIRLLKVEFYHYHADSRQFLFAHHPPYRSDLVMTLKERIEADPFPEVESPLNQRLKLAHKLAEAVFFLHAANYVHKNITLSSVVTFHKQEEEEPEQPSADLEDAYLMGFDLIREAGAITRMEGAVKRAGDERSVWDFDLYQHPNRQWGLASGNYIKAFDVYSLGVVLLEIGMWRPLTSVAPGLDLGNPGSWTGYLVETVAKKLKPVVGEKYYKLVSWCLELGGNDGEKETGFVENLLDPLEEMVSALS